MTDKIYSVYLSICKKNIQMYTSDNRITKIFFDKKTAIRYGIEFFKYSDLYDSEMPSATKFKTNEFNDILHYDYLYEFIIETYSRETIKDDRPISTIITDLMAKYRGKKLYDEILKRVDVGIECYNYRGECLDGILKKYSNDTLTCGSMYSIREEDFNIRKTYAFNVGDHVTKTDLSVNNEYTIVYSPINMYSSEVNMDSWVPNYILKGTCDGKVSWLDAFSGASDYNLKLIED